jgi:hypothetical protein
MRSKVPLGPPRLEEWEQMLTPKEFAKVLKVSVSWLAKALAVLPGRPFGPLLPAAQADVNHHPSRVSPAYIVIHQGSSKYTCMHMY